MSDILLIIDGHIIIRETEIYEATRLKLDTKSLCDSLHRNAAAKITPQVSHKIEEHSQQAYACPE